MRITRRLSYGALVGVTALGLAAAWLTRTRTHHTPPPSEPPPTAIVTHSTPAPAEQPVTQRTYHSTAVGNQPSYIKLPSIQAEGYIQNVGIDQHGAVAAPTNVNLAGWYINSLEPGQPGLSIIDGHVDGKTAPGIFYHLSKLKPGDVIEVDLGNGQKKLFTVRSVQQLPAAAAASALFARDYRLPSQLNLITCGDTWSNSAHAYTDRIVVVAETSS